MLSRVANSLYWMVRYIERADNLARLIEVNERLLLDIDRLNELGPEGFWQPIILSTGDSDLFHELYPETKREGIVRFLTCDRQNSNSIVSCISQARENARMVRDQLSEMLWEELNDLYLFASSKRAEEMAATSPTVFCEAIRRATHAFHGVAASTLNRDEAWEFMDVGRHIERADKTTRFLDVTSLLPEGKMAVPKDLYLVSILKSCGGFGAYRVIYRNELTLKNLTDFLVFSRHFPRSLRYCMDRLDASLHNISGSPRGSYENGAERESGRLLSELAYGSCEEVIESGLHDFLDDLQQRFNRIGDEIFRSYVLLPDRVLAGRGSWRPAAAWAEEASEQEQQQQQQQ